MGWWVECSRICPDAGTWANNIDDLLRDRTDSDGWFRCECGARGYIKKSYKLQEPGETWEPVLKGAIRFGEEGHSYQPFVFLVGYETDEEIEDVWFSYYKDLRSRGGKLKLGYGPGGPPVFSKYTMIELVRELVQRGCLDKAKVKRRLEDL